MTPILAEPCGRWYTIRVKDSCVTAFFAPKFGALQHNLILSILALAAEAVDVIFDTRRNRVAGAFFIG